MESKTVILRRLDGTVSTTTHSHWYAARYIEPIEPTTPGPWGKRTYVRTEWIREGDEVTGAVFDEVASA